KRDEGAEPVERGPAPARVGRRPPDARREGEEPGDAEAGLGEEGGHEGGNGVAGAAGFAQPHGDGGARGGGQGPEQAANVVGLHVRSSQDGRWTSRPAPWRRRGAA